MEARDPVSIVVRGVRRLLLLKPMLSLLQKLQVSTLLLLCCAPSVGSRSYVRLSSQRHIPRFEDYGVGGAIRGHGKIIRIDRWSPTDSEASFNRRIRHAARGGANFAGRYAVVGWSCGFICISLAVVDVPTGRVYRMPFSGVGDGPCPAGFYGDEKQLFEFRGDSCLVVVRGTAEGIDSGGSIEDAPCATRYYVWRRFAQQLTTECYILT
jgi:hypothetical protein